MFWKAVSFYAFAVGLLCGFYSGFRAGMVLPLVSSIALGLKGFWIVTGDGLEYLLQYAGWAVIRVFLDDLGGCS